MKPARLLLAAVLVLGAAGAVRAEARHPMSRLIIFDARGSEAEETTLILDQRGETVKVWYRNYLGRRTGTMPYAEYDAAFEAMRRIPEFALRKEHRGRALRANAARGTVTLAWQDGQGKQIRTIRYYAPENTLDDFRKAFNRLWALARYAILSPDSFTSPKLEYREDALYYLSRGGWLTSKEISDVVRYHVDQGQGPRLARAVWAALDLPYAPRSEFADWEYRAYSVRSALVRLGEPAAAHLRGRLPHLTGRRRALAETVLAELAGAP